MEVSRKSMPAPLKPVGPDSRSPGVESFSKFDGMPWHPRIFQRMHLAPTKFQSQCTLAPTSLTELPPRNLLKIWCLQVKGLQSYWLSNFENDSTPGDLESRPTGSSGGRGWASDFFLGLDSMQVTLKPFTEPLFTQLKDLSLLEKYTKNQGASYNFRLGFALSNRPHHIDRSGLQLSWVLSKTYSTTPTVPMGIWGSSCDPRT